MKELLIGLAVTIVYTIIMVFSQDYSLAQQQYFKLKYVCEEVSASASLFYERSEYAVGRKIFDQVEGREVIDNQIQTLLRLDDSFNPLPNSYYTDRVSYEAYFFDDSNTIYPEVFTDPDTFYTRTIGDPTVIVTINAGEPRYRLTFIDAPDMVLSSSHEWMSRD